MAEAKHPNGTATVQIDNERVRVTEWRFRPGETTGHHTHGFDYVVIPTASGTLRIVAPNGTASAAELKVGHPYYRNAGVEHDVINADDHDVSFIEVEIKTRPE
jgi:beta-alanine degradation protein BauB